MYKYVFECFLNKSYKCSAGKVTWAIQGIIKHTGVLYSSLHDTNCINFHHPKDNYNYTIMEKYIWNMRNIDKTLTEGVFNRKYGVSGNFLLSELTQSHIFNFHGRWETVFTCKIKKVFYAVLFFRVVLFSRRLGAPWNALIFQHSEIFYIYIYSSFKNLTLIRQFKPELCKKL